MRVNRKSTNKKLIIASLASILLVGGLSYGVIAQNQELWPFEASNNSVENQEGNDGSEINYDPPTETEIEHSQDGKKNSAPQNEQSDKPDTKSSTKTKVSLGVTFADVVGSNVEVRAFTPSIIESDGTCTATLTKGNLKVTKSSKAFIDSTSTLCQPIIIPTSEFNQNGKWSLVLSYDSSTSAGKSEIIEVSIP